MLRYLLISNAFDALPLIIHTVPFEHIPEKKLPITYELSSKFANTIIKIKELKKALQFD
jgi:hypothetical protein